LPRASSELEGEEVVRHTAVTRDPATQMMHVRMRYERRRGGEILGEERVDFHMRYFYRYEVEHLLARAGFVDLELYGGYDGRPYDYVSGELVVVARAGS
jgi:hypothetical protein